MENTWIVFEGGVNDIFDETKNKNKKHIRDDALVPFKTKPPCPHTWHHHK